MLNVNLVLTICKGKPVKNAKKVFMKKNKILQQYAEVVLINMTHFVINVMKNIVLGVRKVIL